MFFREDWCWILRLPSLLPTFLILMVFSGQHPSTGKCNAFVRLFKEHRGYRAWSLPSCSKHMEDIVYSITSWSRWACTGTKYRSRKLTRACGSEKLLFPSRDLLQKGCTTYTFPVGERNNQEQCSLNLTMSEPHLECVLLVKVLD